MKGIENMNMQEAAAMQRKIFADRLRILRNNAGLTQKQLSERSGVNLRTLQQYESQSKDINKASGVILLSLAKALDCSVEELLSVS